MAAVLLVLVIGAGGAFVAVKVIGGIASLGPSKTNVEYTKGRIAGRCPRSPIVVGDRIELRAKVRNLSGVDWPNTYVFLGADHFVREVLGDDAGTIATPNSLGDFQLRGIRPHSVMSLYAVLVAKDAGNFTIELDAWGSGNVDQGLPNKAPQGTCDMTVNP